ncbi:MAG TPA: zf-HC2 domain-containing protein [Bryobacteraceae bacterium]|nr:zf-HC2 domain-containing protein [Bryobacteraceae bacterium]
MECPSKYDDPSELLIAYAEGSLEPAARFAFERHLERCALCRELAAAQRELWAALDSWTPTSISSDFDERLYQRIAAAEQQVPAKYWRRILSENWPWRPAMPVAAACAALIAVFLLHGPSPEPITAPADQAFAGPQIEQVESALQDFEMLKQMGLPSAQETSARQKM